MGYMHGRIFEDTTLPGMTAADRRAAFSSLCQNLAQLHSVDYTEADTATKLGKFGRKGGYLQRQIKAWGGQVGCNMLFC
jgi:aminoglycoside phosphotransferase (APT) family kinase protein